VEVELMKNSQYCESKKLGFGFDVSKLQRDIEKLNFQNFEYYNVIPLRSPAHLVDESLPFPESVTDFADGTWTDWMDTPALSQSPYLMEVINYFRQFTTVNLVRLLRLAPGAIVQEHKDPTLGLEQEKSMIRLTIPIQGTEGVHFWLNDKIVPMALGECWYLRLSDPHRVANRSDKERINLTIDIIPNDWVFQQMVE